MPTIKDSVFIEVALRKSAIEPERLKQARETQAELQSFGISKFIGVIAAEKGAPRDVVRAIAEEANSLWIRCPNCKEPNALAQSDRNGRLQCSACSQSIEYASDRISEEDLGLSIRPPHERRKNRKAPPAAQTKHEQGEGPSPPRTLDGPQKPKRAPPAGSAPKEGAQVPAREGAGAAFLLDNAPVGDVTKFKVRGIIAASPGGRLYRIEGGGELGALKLLDSALASDKAQLKKWIDAVQVMQDLPRSASLKPLEFHREGAAAYVVRPYLEDARTLRGAIEVGSDEVRSPEAAIRIAGAMLESLAAFHSASISHGNLKPENVLLTAEGACFTDAGMLVLFQGLPAEERALRIWESCRYQAPEVLQGKDSTPASDIYSMGRMIQEVLDCMDEEDRRSDKAVWLQKLAGRMAAEDPVARYSSAKDVLWDFRAHGVTKSPVRKGTSSNGSPTPPPRRTARRGRRPAVRRLAGPVLLAVVLIGIACQAGAWYSARKAMASPHRAEEVSSRLIEGRIRSLGRSTVDGSIDPSEAEKRWKEFGETFRGTPWEQRVEEASRGPLEGLSRRRGKEVSDSVSKALSLAERREWALALKCLLALGADVSSSEAQEALHRISEGLFEDEGMVLVPRGDVTVAGGKTAPVGPFLIDAGLLTQVVRDAVRTRRSTPAGEQARSGPPAGVSFEEAKEIGTLLGKRIPSAREWDRLAAIVSSPKGIEEASAKRIRDLEALFQWVEDEGEDDLSKAGYGWCRGGKRPGVPATYPARRKKAIAQDDVGIRFARDL